METKFFVYSDFQQYYYALQQKKYRCSLKLGLNLKKNKNRRNVLFHSTVFQRKMYYINNNILSPAIISILEVVTTLYNNALKLLLVRGLVQVMKMINLFISWVKNYTGISMKSFKSCKERFTYLT